MTQAHLRDMLKKASGSFYRSYIVVSNEPLSPTLSAFLPMKTPPKNKEEGHNDREPAEEGDIQIGCTAQVEEQKQKLTS